MDIECEQIEKETLEIKIFFKKNNKKKKTENEKVRKMGKNSTKSEEVAAKPSAAEALVVRAEDEGHFMDVIFGIWVAGALVSGEIH